MVLYNTLAGFCAALVLFIAADILKRFPRGESVLGHGVALLTVGTPLFLLSLHGTLTWPLTVNPPINIAFWEPSLFLGALALVGGTTILRQLHLRPDFNYGPMMWMITGVGGILLATSAAIFRFNLVGDAPPIEPITGQFQGWENTTFGLVYLLGAIGCLLVSKVENYWIYKLVRFSWIGTGIFFLLFCTLNYYTHIGMLVCAGKGVCYPW